MTERKRPVARTAARRHRRAGHALPSPTATGGNSSAARLERNGIRHAATKHDVIGEEIRSARTPCPRRRNGKKAATPTSGTGTTAVPRRWGASTTTATSRRRRARGRSTIPSPRARRPPPLRNADAHRASTRRADAQPSARPRRSRTPRWSCRGCRRSSFPCRKYGSRSCRRTRGGDTSCSSPPRDCCSPTAPTTAVSSVWDGRPPPRRARGGAMGNTASRSPRS